MKPTPSNAATSLRCRGMRDLLPDEMERFRRVEETFARICRSWGYREVRTPTIEYLHLFTSAGTLSPQMLGRVYSFLDWDGWSGERVVLRPDATIPVARLYAEHLAGRTAKLFYVGNVFRFSTGDETREDWQCGVELIGDTGAAGDIELLLLGVDVLRSLGLPAPAVVLSHAGLVGAVLQRAGLTAEDQAASYDRLLDGDLSVIGEVEARLPELDAPLHLLFDMDGGAGYLENVRAALAPAIPELVGPLDELSLAARLLTLAGVDYRIRAVLARSFEYYSGTVFRFQAGGRDVGGGGRYDNLIGLVSGGASVPASGFALNVAALAPLAPAPAAGAAPVAVRPKDGSAAALAGAFAAAAGLRDRGVPASIAGGTDVNTVRPSDGGFMLSAAGTDRWFASLDDLAAALRSGQ